MSKLYFRYGAMNCGKSSALMQVAYNYEQNNKKVIVIKSEIDTKGSVRAKAISIGDASGSFNKFVAIKSLVKKIINISKKLIDKIKKVADVSILMERPLFSDTNLDIEIGIAKVEIVSNNEYVGVAIVNKLIPYSPIILV